MNQCMRIMITVVLLWNFACAVTINNSSENSDGENSSFDANTITTEQDRKTINFHSNNTLPTTIHEDFMIHRTMQFSDDLPIQDLQIIVNPNIIEDLDHNEKIAYLKHIVKTAKNIDNLLSQNPFSNYRIDSSKSVSSMIKSLNDSEKIACLTHILKSTHPKLELPNQRAFSIVKSIHFPDKSIAHYNILITDDLEQHLKPQEKTDYQSYLDNKNTDLDGLDDFTIDDDDKSIDLVKWQEEATIFANKSMSKYTVKFLDQLKAAMNIKKQAKDLDSEIYVKLQKTAQLIDNFDDIDKRLNKLKDLDYINDNFDAIVNNLIRLNSRSQVLTYVNNLIELSNKSVHESAKNNSETEEPKKTSLLSSLWGFWGSS